jgi:hypothetical protein
VPVPRTLPPGLPDPGHVAPAAPGPGEGPLSYGMRGVRS